MRPAGAAFSSTEAPDSHTTPHFPRDLKEKAFSKGVVFEKESNHLSLCIIAGGKNISARLRSTCSPARRSWISLPAAL